MYFLSGAGLGAVPGFDATDREIAAAIVNVSTSFPSFRWLEEQGATWNVSVIDTSYDTPTYNLIRERHGDNPIQLALGNLPNTGNSASLIRSREDVRKILARAPTPEPPPDDGGGEIPQEETPFPKPDPDHPGTPNGGGGGNGGGGSNGNGGNDGSTPPPPGDDTPPPEPQPSGPEGMPGWLPWAAGAAALLMLNR